MKRLRRIAGALLLVVVVGVVGAFIALRVVLAASLPRISGEAVVAGLDGPVEVTRDGYGVPAIVAETPEDAARALGFVHAQDRFFQMDLQRRYAAGELAELLGRSALSTDVRQRKLRMREAARRIITELPERHQRLIEAYTQGVNAGVADLGARPPEYLLLRSRPAPWRAEDSALAMLAMFDALSTDARSEKRMAVMQASLPPELYEFLTPDVSRFDSPLLVTVGEEAERFTPMPIPGPEVIDLRNVSATERERGVVSPSDFGVGSNNWAVAGWRSEHGGAILANDMHLMITAPGIWHRAQWTVGGVRAAGVTLPGTPGLISGTNGRIAWGFTNTNNDSQDLIVIDVDPADPSRYRTPGGWATFGEITEVINVRGGAPERVPMRTTIWGVVTDTDWQGRPLVLKWTALEPGMVNVGVFDMTTAATLEEAVETARAWRGPSQNVLIADDRGRIAWVVSGYLPKRTGLNGQTPVSWAEPGVGWDGPLAEEQRPMLVDPPEGILYTANNRTADVATARAMATSWGPAMRATRIAEMLRESETFSEADLLAMQLDTRASIYDYYRDIALESVDATNDADPLLRRARAVIEGWNGQADADQPGYRLLRSFRRELHERMMAPLVGAAIEADSGFVYRWPLAEEPVRRILEERPAHLLPPGADAEGGWPAFLRATLLATVEKIEKAHPERGVETPWGEVNAASVRHALSPALGKIGRWLLDMPRDAQSGDALVVRVATPTHGASERLIVSPGREERAIMHIPAGQSGHFLSRHYADSHEAWLQGLPTPLLSGARESGFRLVPAGGAEAVKAGVGETERRSSTTSP